MNAAVRAERRPLAVANGTPRRPWKPALLWLAFLGPFFFATYGFANWLASIRIGVPAVVFDWEHRIPFLAWTIVPYWSIDLLYAISLFLCTTRRELDTHGKRLAAAQLLCVTVFVAFPLRFTFERPETAGVFGAMFDVLMGFDKPFNQMPSLHIALLVVIWLRFVRHVPGPARGLVHAWAALIAVSALTTWQHHFIDIVTGFWAGWLCVWLLPEEGGNMRFSLEGLRDGRRRRIAMIYAAGAATLAACALLIGGWALWLLWPAASAALVAAIYAAIGENAFQKASDGRLSAAAWWLLAPYLACAWVNSRWWTRRQTPADAVVPGLCLGRVPSRRECAAYRAIVDLSAELPCAAAYAGYVNVPQLDLTVASADQLDRAVAAIGENIDRGPVLVCCALGYSRSAAAVAAWLLASGNAADAHAAVAMTRRARPGVVLHEDHLRLLQRYEGVRQAARAAAA